MALHQSVLREAAQSKPFIEAARTAVDGSEGTLETVIRKLAPATKPKLFSAATEAEARKQFVSWKRAHPNAIIIEKGLIGSESEGTAPFTIHITHKE